MVRKSRVGLVVLVVAVCLFAGCVRQDPKPNSHEPAFLEAVELASGEFEGQILTGSKEGSISPDGKYLLAAVVGDSEESMAVFPLPRETGLLESPTPLYSVDGSWTKEHLVQWLSVGWLSKDTPVFLVHGWQDRGDYKGKRGTAVMTGDLVTGSASVTAFMEIPEVGQVVDEFVLAKGKLIIRAAHKIWSVDLKTGQQRVVREDFPHYGPLFYLAISPGGGHAVYNLYDDDGHGVFIMNLETGEERLLVPGGDTFSFYPAWSPDGRYIMAYTAGSFTPPEGEGLSYSFLPSEDGPLPAADQITVVDVEGNLIRTFSLEGQGPGKEYLFFYSWLPDSKHVLFVSGPVVQGKWGEVKSLAYESVWIGDVSGDGPVSWCGALLDVADGPVDYVFPVAALPDSTGALLNVHCGETSVIVRAKEGSLERITEGWWDWPRLRVTFSDSVAGIVCQDSGCSLWLIGPDTARKVTEKDTNNLEIVGYNGDTLILASGDFWDNRCTLYVYKVAER